MNRSLYPLFFIIFIAAIFYTRNDEEIAPLPNTEEESFILSDSTRSYLAEFERDFNSGMSQRGIPGGAVVIIQGSNVIYQKGFGVKVKGTTDSVDVHTVFRLGSVSKGFASVLAGTYVDGGILSWDDPIISHLPDFQLNDQNQAERVEIKHVLSHTTGLPRHAYTNLVEDGLTLSRIIPRFKDVALINKEGEQLAYQNAAYAIVEKVIEANEDSTFSNALREKLFEPLEMYSSSSSYKDLFDNNNKAMPHLFHSRRNGLMPASISKKYYNAISAGGINASISDMGKWLLMLTGNKPDIISPEVLDEIYEPLATINNRRFSRYWDGVNRSHYGLGWRILDNHGQEIVYHGGYVNGFRSEIAFDPERQIGICILFNSPNSYALQVIPEFFNEFTPISTSDSTITPETK